ncbi:MAG: cytochrome P450 [Gammaproteobacteria bacterium]
MTHAYTVPAHVPSERVVDFDFWRLPEGESDAFGHYERLRTAGTPEIVWSPYNGGHWIFCGFQAVREGYQNYGLFTSTGDSIPPVPGEKVVLIPNSLDPPEHTPYRNLLNPLFSPAQMARLQPRVRSTAVALIDGIASAGQCDFAADYAMKYPTSLLVYVVGLPESMLPTFLQWEHTFFRSTSLEERAAAQANIVGYLNEYVNAQAANPGEGIIGTLLRTKLPDGRLMTPGEVARVAHLFFLAGLDTVPNTLSFIFHHLTRYPRLQAELHEHPDRIPQYTLEFLRLYSVAALARTVREDVEFRGVRLQAGDRVLLPTMMANHDASEFPNPLEIDIQRENKAFITFGAGPHRCIGSHLARQEIDVTLEEWFKRIGRFELAPGAAVKSALGNTLGMYSLPLVWKPN